MWDAIRTVLLSATLAVGAAASFAEDYPFWQSNWDKELPNVKLEKVSMEGDSITSLWKVMCSSYFIRCNLYLREETSTSKFVFSRQECQASELLDSLASHFGYSWTQDSATGVIWIHPSEKSIDDILGETVRVAEQSIDIPMHTGILEPMREALPWGTLFTQAWSDVWLNTFDYPVCIPKGNQTVRAVLNYCCLWGPSQAFLALPGVGGVYLTDVNLPYDKYKMPSPGTRLFWVKEIGPLPEGERPSDDELGIALGSAEPRKRWAAQQYLIMCSNTEKTMERMTRRLPELPLNEQTAWELIGFAAAQNRRPDKFPVSTVVGPLKRLSAPETIKTLSADAALLVGLSLSVYAADDSALGLANRLDEVRIENALLDLIRLSNFSPSVSAALFDESAPNYIGDKIRGLPKRDHVGFHKLKIEKEVEVK